MSKLKLFVVGGLLTSLLLSAGNLGVCTNSVTSNNDGAGNTGYRFVKRDAEMKGSDEDKKSAKGMPVAGKVAIGTVAGLVVGAAAGTGTYCYCVKRRENLRRNGLELFRFNNFLYDSSLNYLFMFRDEKCLDEYLSKSGFAAKDGSISKLLGDNGGKLAKKILQDLYGERFYEAIKDIIM